MLASELDGWKFRRQHPIGPYYVDFCCLSARLIVEVDGPAHDFDDTSAYDQRRDAYLESIGYKVLRIPVADIDRELDDVMHRVFAELFEREALGFQRRPLRRLRRHLPMNGEDIISESPGAF
ncbi:MAG TPA: endonuclease domain-containing protein [Candidatus Dormibacteraeota bacterium]|nr:endonuclease domain-containing protein [Candidatus Dormibacteraeota bacterium]